MVSRLPGIRNLFPCGLPELAVTNMLLTTHLAAFFRGLGLPGMG
jgi:hypothetical protein